MQIGAANDDTVSTGSVATALASGAGVVVGLVWSLRRSKRACVDVFVLGTAVLGSMVSLTACALHVTPYEGMLIGGVGAYLILQARAFFISLRIDDPLAAASIFGVGGLWSLVATALLAQPNVVSPLQTSGLLHGGHISFLGEQLLGCLALTVWSMGLTMACLVLLNQILPVRVSLTQQLMGLDSIDHNIVAFVRDQVEVARVRASFAVGGLVCPSAQAFISAQAVGDAMMGAAGSQPSSRRGSRFAGSESGSQPASRKTSRVADSGAPVPGPEHRPSVNSWMDVPKSASGSVADLPRLSVSPPRAAAKPSEGYIDVCESKVATNL